MNGTMNGTMNYRMFDRDGEDLGTLQDASEADLKAFVAPIGGRLHRMRDSGRIIVMTDGGVAGRLIPVR